MSIIVTGVKGQLGYDVVKEIKLRGNNDVIGIDINDLDITNKDDVENFFQTCKPKIIIHCAAYTAVDKAEENEETCYKINVLGTKYLVEEAKKYQAKILYISTDYVFDGQKHTPYEICDTPNPISVYGKTKFLGEIETLKYDKSFIVRISWVFGKNGHNFIQTMLKLSKERNTINVVNDQYGSPTYTYDLSKYIVDLINTEKYGIYHATNEGSCTWFEFAKEIFSLAKIDILVNPILTKDYITKATRPINSTMSKSSLDLNGFNRLPHWKDALERYLKEIEVI